MCEAPCRTRFGCKKGTPENPRSLSDSNQLAYEHYKQCRAVGQFPDDSIVRENAAIIRGVEDQFKRYETKKASSDLMQILAMVK